MSATEVAKAERETLAAMRLPNGETYVWGVDVSHHQGKVDYQGLVEGGCEFVIAKATEGQTHRDPRWVENAIASQLSGAYFGAYHFARIDTDTDDPLDARLEAENLARAIDAVGGATWLENPLCLGTVIDLEWFGSLSARDERDHVSKNVAWAIAFCEHAERLLGRSQMVYTGPNVWRERFGAAGDLAHLPLWIVDLEAPGDFALVEAGVGGWHAVLHQWTHTGRVQGVRARVDVNIAVGGKLGLEALADRRLTRPEGAVVSPIQSLMRNLLGIGEASFAELDAGDVATLQGLLLARGYGPRGLVDRAGRPDGVFGPSTLEALRRFLAARGLVGSQTGITARDWVELLRG